MNDVNWEEAYKLTERLRDENTRLRSVNAQLLAALRELLPNVDINHPQQDVHTGELFYDVEFHMIDKKDYDRLAALAESEPKQP